MPLSQTALQAVLASATEKTFLECLTFEHSELQHPIRVVNDTVNLTRNSGVFKSFPFNVRSPSQTEENPPVITITITLVDQQIIFALRSLAGSRERAKITYEVVLSDTPNTIEFGPVSFDFDGAQSDGISQLTISASFLKGALDDAFPAQQFSPGNADL